MPDLWIATGNRKKRHELERLLGPLGVTLRTPDEAPGVYAPVEDQPDFAGNARVKARALARLTGGVALADDSGLCVDALGGAPGVHSARYGGPGLDDRGRIEHLLRALAGVPAGRRGAAFHCALCLCGPDGEVRATAEGTCPGVLLTAVRGEGGFGYDPLFIARAHLELDPAPTFAELDATQKDEVGHRGQALRRLLRTLQDDPSLLLP